MSGPGSLIGMSRGDWEDTVEALVARCVRRLRDEHRRETVSLGNAARILGVTPNTVKVLASQGYLRALVVKGEKQSTWKIGRPSIDEFLRTGGLTRIDGHTPADTTGLEVAV